MFDHIASGGIRTHDLLPMGVALPTELPKTRDEGGKASSLCWSLHLAVVHVDISTDSTFNISDVVRSGQAIRTINVEKVFV